MDGQESSVCVNVSLCGQLPHVRGKIWPRGWMITPVKPFVSVFGGYIAFNSSLYLHNSVSIVIHVKADTAALIGQSWSCFDSLIYAVISENGTLIA